MIDLRNHWDDDPIFDSAIVAHGFAPHMRDYDVIVEIPAPKPGGSGAYIEGRYRYRFTHCVSVRIETALTPENWKLSWADLYITWPAWNAAGQPAGFPWGLGYADAYPGASTVVASTQAAGWSERLGQAMHEVQIETNVYTLSLICHDLRIDRLAEGDPKRET